MQLCRRSWSTNRSVIGVYNLGDACVAPTQTSPRQDPVLRAGAFHGRRCFRLRDPDYSPHISSAARRGRRPLGDPWYPESGFSVGRSGSTQGGKNSIDSHRHPFRGSVFNFVDVRGRQIVPLEAFTTWATHASPLYRHAPDKTRYCVPGRSMGAVPFLYATMMILRPGSVGDPWYPEGSTQGGKNSMVHSAGVQLCSGDQGQPNAGEKTESTATWDVSTQGGRNRIDGHGRIPRVGVQLCRRSRSTNRSVRGVYAMGDARVALWKKQDQRPRTPAEESNTSRRRVRSSMRSRSTSTPMPGLSQGTATSPSAFMVHSGVTMSRSQ